MGQKAPVTTVAAHWVSLLGLGELSHEEGCRRIDQARVGYQIIRDVLASILGLSPGDADALENDHCRYLKNSVIPDLAYEWLELNANLSKSGQATVHA